MAVVEDNGLFVGDWGTVFQLILRLKRRWEARCDAKLEKPRAPFDSEEIVVATAITRIVCLVESCIVGTRGYKDQWCGKVVWLNLGSNLGCCCGRSLNFW